MKNQEMILVTPEMALSIIKGGENKRPFNIRKMLQYSDDMKAGLWRRGTYEFIKIAPSGLVVDGVHRLRAVIHSGVSVWLQIVTGISEDLFDVLDTGKSRDGADVLAIIGVKNRNAVASIIRRHDALIEGNKNKSIKVLKNREIIQIYQRRPEFWDEVTLRGINVCRNNARLITPKSAGSVMAYISDRWSQDASFRFFDDIVSNNNDKSPIIGVLQKKLIQSKVSKIGRLSDYVIEAYILKSFKFWAAGDTVKRLKYNPEIEEYPFL